MKTEARIEKPGTRLVGVIFLGAAVLLVLSTIFIYRVGLNAIEAQSTMANQLVVLRQLDDFLASATQAETGQRGYLLTGDEAYLQPYTAAHRQVRNRLAGLRRLARDGELAKERVDHIGSLTEQKLSELEQTIQLRKNAGFDAAIAIVRNNRGRNAMDGIRSELSQMRSREELEFASATDRANSSASVRTTTFIVACLLNLIFLGWAFGRISEEVRRREVGDKENSRQKELLATTLSSIGDGVIVTDETGRVTFLNTEAERLTGWKNDDAVNQPLPDVFQIINEHTRKPAENPVDKVIREGAVVGLTNHTILIAKGGMETSIDDSAAPIRRSGGPLLGVVLVFRDFTLQRQAYETATRLAAVVEYSGDAIVTKNLDSIIQTWNAGAQRLFGYRPEEIIGKSVTTLFPPDRIQEEDRIIAQLKQGKPLERLETIRVAKDGRNIPVLVSVSPLKDDDGNIVGASKIIHDITDLVAAREEIQRKKDLLATTLASIGDAVIVTDAQGNINFLNREAERLTGWKDQDANGKALPEVFRINNELTHEPVENPVEKVIRLGTVVGLANHTVLIARDGTETCIDDSAAPIRHNDGPLLGVVLVFRDFTSQRQAHVTSARLAAIVESSGDAIITKNLEGIVQTWNSGAERMFGYRPEEIIGKHVTTLFPSDRLDEEDAILDRIRHGNPIERLETIRVAKDGRKIPVLISISPLNDADGNVIGASKIIQDITELVAARTELQREKELLGTTLASIGDAVIVTDEQGRVNFLNREAELLTGWSNHEAAGRPLPGVFHIINERTNQPAENPVEKVLRLGTIVGLANHTLLVRRDGARLAIDDSAAPIRESGGPLFGVVLVFRDFTERKEAEEKLRAAHEQLASRAVQLETLVKQRTARLNETVGDLEAFSYSIVHDLRAPLRAMQNFAQLLAEECGPISPTAHDYVRRIVTAAERMDRLIQDVLNYSRVARTDLPLSPLDPGALIRGIIVTYPAFQPPHARVELHGEFPRIIANEAVLTQCVSNLLGNAVKFVDIGVMPNVRIWAERQDSRVKLFFQDNGIGIEKESHEKIFQIFQRLSKRYEGTGIGLAIVKKGVEKMGGSVGLKSSPDNGSTFWLELAAADSDSAPPELRARINDNASPP